MKSKNPLRDYRKAIVAVMAKYFAVDVGAIRFKTNVLRTHRAYGDSPAYVALSYGYDHGLLTAPQFRGKARR